jgi:hypothetical protein
MIPIFVGLDAREAIVHHVFCNSIARRTARVVGFTPLSRADHRDGSNSFTYARFMVPFLTDFRGWAIYADGDMVCRGDIAELWNLRDERYAVMVAKHDYRTRSPVKYLGAANRDYPRKNWSSVMLWNCAHPYNSVLTPSFVGTCDGWVMHRFGWLPDSLVGDLPLEWNWLVGEYPHNDRARLLHYTLGAPCFADYADCDHAHEWHEERLHMSTPA